MTKISTHISDRGFRLFSFYNVIADGVVKQSPFRFTGLTVSREQIDAVIEQAHAAGKRLVGYEEMLGFAILGGNQPVPEDGFGIVLRDGYESHAEVANDLMNKHRAGVILACPAGYIGTDKHPHGRASWTNRIDWMVNGLTGQNSVQLPDGSTHALSTDEDKRKFRDAFRRHGKNTDTDPNKLVALIAGQLDITEVPICPDTDLDRKMSWKDIRSLIQAGHSFAPVGYMHRTSPNLASDAETEEQIFSSAGVVRAYTDIPADLYAHPEGRYNENHFSTLKKAGYKGALLTSDGIIDNETNPMLLPTVEVTRDRLEFER